MMIAMIIITIVYDDFCITMNDDAMIIITMVYDHDKVQTANTNEWTASILRTTPDRILAASENVTK